MASSTTNLGLIMNTTMPELTELFFDLLKKRNDATCAAERCKDAGETAKYRDTLESVKSLRRDISDAEGKILSESSKHLLVFGEFDNQAFEAKGKINALYWKSRANGAHGVPVESWEPADLVELDDSCRAISTYLHERRKYLKFVQIFRRASGDSAAIDESVDEWDHKLYNLFIDVMKASEEVVWGLKLACSTFEDHYQDDAFIEVLGPDVRPMRTDTDSDAGGAATPVMKSATDTHTVSKLRLAIVTRLAALKVLNCALPAREYRPLEGQDVAPLNAFCNSIGLPIRYSDTAVRPIAWSGDDYDKPAGLVDYLASCVAHAARGEEGIVARIAEMLPRVDNRIEAIAYTKERKARAQRKKSRGVKMEAQTPAIERLNADVEKTVVALELDEELRPEQKAAVVRFVNQLAERYGSDYRLSDRSDARPLCMLPEAHWGEVSSLVERARPAVRALIAGKDLDDSAVSQPLLRDALQSLADIDKAFGRVKVRHHGA